MKTNIFCTFSILISFFFLSPLVGAQSQSKGISFQGVIKTPAGQFPTISGTTVLVKILSPNDCILREESFSGVNISNGYLNLVIGRGAPTSNNPNPARDLKTIMNNSMTLSGLACLAPDGSLNSLTTSYEPHVGDGRKLRISLQIENDSVSAEFNMRAVAYAVNSETLNGKTESSFLNVNSVAGLNQANAESVFQRYSQLDNILNGNYSGSVTGNVSGTAQNVTGVVGLVNGGTGANSAAGARNNLGLKALALIDLPSPIDTSKFLRGDGTWASIVGGVSTVAGRAGDVVITTADLADFSSTVDARALGQITSLKAQVNGLATLDGNGKVPGSQLALTASDIPDLDASKINSGTLSVNVNTTLVNAGTGQFTQLKMTDGAGKAITMSREAGGADYSIQWPANVGAAGQILQTDASGVLSWVAIPSAPVLSVAGKTGLVTLVRTDVGGLGSAAALDVGTAATNIVQLDGSAKVPESLLPNTGGDLSGSLSNADVVKIRGNAVVVGSLTAPDAGKVYRWTGTGFIAGFLNFGDLRTSSGAQQLAAICTASEKIQWSSISDSFTCQPIGSLSASVITAGIMDSARLPAASNSSDGIVNQLSQSFKGIKTFIDGVVVQSALSVSGALSAASASISGAVTAQSVAASGDVTAGGAGNFDRIKLSNSTVPCDSSNEGSMRYNSSTKKFEGCNGTTWASISQGVLASLAIGSPSSSLVKSGPVSFTITYGSGVDTATITLAPENISINGVNTGCVVTGVAGTGNTRTATVNSCSGTGSVSISVVPGTAKSTTGDDAASAGPSPSYQVDNTGPSTPSGLALGSVPTNFTNSPTITFSPGSDVGGGTVANHQVRIVRTSDSVVMKDWTNHSSGSDVSGMSLASSTQYSVFVRAVDSLGNVGASTTATNWTTVAALYPFLSHTFSNCGQTGQSGPTLSQCTSSYSAASWTSNTSYFNLSSGAQLWTVPSTGTYRITIAGAAGGTSYSAGGRGAVIRGDFSLTQGAVVRIIVGQKGVASTASATGYAAGGGGGSFVSINSSSTPLIVAGGGGGGGSNYSSNPSYPGKDGSYTESGTQGNSPSSTAVPASTGGQGGKSPGLNEYTAENGVAGGGGWYSAALTGHNGSGGGGAGNSTALGGGASEGGVGGFGGGGGGRNVAGGGAGGYSGGNGGTYSSGTLGGAYSAGGGGGGCFNAGTTKVDVGYNTGDGYVTIDKM